MLPCRLSASTPTSQGTEAHRSGRVPEAPLFRGPTPIAQGGTRMSKPSQGEESSLA